MLYEVVIWIGSFVILISFILSIILSLNSHTINYMKWFFIIPLIALILSINTIINLHFHLLSKTSLYQIQLLLTFAELFVWCRYFLVLNKSKFDSGIIILVFSFFSLITACLFIFNKFNEPNLQIICLFSISKTIFCIYYYYKLFKSPPIHNLKKDPSFWTVNGLLFYSCLSIPFYSFHSYISFRFSKIEALDIFSISNMLIIIMHFFFIKGYICSLRLHKVS